jgi:hypothetical protein
MIAIEELEVKSLENKIFLFLFLILSFLMIIIGISLVYHYQNMEKRVKNELLNTNSSKLRKLTIEELANVYHQLATTTDNSEVSSIISNYTIDACYKEKCKSFNLLKFGPILDRTIPEYILYKIKLNEALIYSNTKLPSYEIENSHLLNEQTILTIGLSISEVFWQKKQLEIREPYKNIFIASLVFIALNGILFKYLLRFYGTKIYQYYKKIFFSQEEVLLHKIWSQEYKRKKELELNYLFIKKANKLILSNEGMTGSESSILSLPCNISLYHKDHSEKVSIIELKCFFSEIFNLEKNFSISLVSQNDTIDFQSKELLYQILYSIFNYLAFCFEKTKNLENTAEVKCYIGQESLKFECKGFSILQGDEGNIQTNQFFKNHANVFILSLEQIFSILEQLKFKCMIKNGDEISLSKIQGMDNSRLQEKKSINMSLILPFKRKE